MPNFIIAYHGSTKPESPEEGAKQMQRWQAWLEGLGDAVVNPGTPLKNNHIVSAEGTNHEEGANRFNGFSVVKADNMEQALEMAKACPYLEMGTIEVAEMLQM